MYLGINSKGQIDRLEKIVSLPSSNNYRSGIAGPNEQIYGSVVSQERNADGSSMVIGVDFGSGTAAYEVGRKPVYIYEISRGIVRSGTSEDIDGASKVFILISNLDVRQVVVIK